MGDDIQVTIERSQTIEATIEHDHYDVSIEAGIGAKKFTDLTDAPHTYSGQAAKLVRVKSAEDGVEFVTAGGGTLDHAGLSNLAYATSGHTGFEPLTNYDSDYGCLIVTK